MARWASPEPITAAESVVVSAMRWKAVGLVALVGFKRGAVGDVVTFRNKKGSWPWSEPTT